MPVQNVFPPYQGLPNYGRNASVQPDYRADPSIPWSGHQWDPFQTGSQIRSHSEAPLQVLAEDPNTQRFRQNFPWLFINNPHHSSNPAQEKKNALEIKHRGPNNPFSKKKALTMTRGKGIVMQMCGQISEKNKKLPETRQRNKAPQNDPQNKEESTAREALQKMSPEGIPNVLERLSSPIPSQNIQPTSLFDTSQWVRSPSHSSGLLHNPQPQHLKNWNPSPVHPSGLLHKAPWMRSLSPANINNAIDLSNPVDANAQWLDQRYLVKKEQTDQEYSNFCKKIEADASNYMQMAKQFVEMRKKEQLRTTSQRRDKHQELLCQKLKLEKTRLWSQAYANLAQEVQQEGLSFHYTPESSSLHDDPPLHQEPQNSEAKKVLTRSIEMKRSESPRKSLSRTRSHKSAASEDPPDSALRSPTSYRAWLRLVQSPPVSLSPKKKKGRATIQPNVPPYQVGFSQTSLNSQIPRQKLVTDAWDLPRNHFMKQLQSPTKNRVKTIATGYSIDGRPRCTQSILSSTESSELIPKARSTSPRKVRELKSSHSLEPPRSHRSDTESYPSKPSSRVSINKKSCVPLSHKKTNHEHTKKQEDSDENWTPHLNIQALYDKEILKKSTSPSLKKTSTEKKHSIVSPSIENIQKRSRERISEDILLQKGLRSPSHSQKSNHSPKNMKDTLKGSNSKISQGKEFSGNTHKIKKALLAELSPKQKWRSINSMLKEEKERFHETRAPLFNADNDREGNPHDFEAAARSFDPVSKGISNKNSKRHASHSPIPDQRGARTINNRYDENSPEPPQRSPAHGLLDHVGVQRNVNVQASPHKKTRGHGLIDPDASLRGLSSEHINLDLVPQNDFEHHKLANYLNTKGPKDTTYNKRNHVGSQKTTILHHHIIPDDLSGRTRSLPSTRGDEDVQQHRNNRYTTPSRLPQENTSSCKEAHKEGRTIPESRMDNRGAPPHIMDLLGISSNRSFYPYGPTGIDQSLPSQHTALMGSYGYFPPTYPPHPIHPYGLPPPSTHYPPHPSMIPYATPYHVPYATPYPIPPHVESSVRIAGSFGSPIPTTQDDPNIQNTNNSSEQQKREKARKASSADAHPSSSHSPTKTRKKKQANGKVLQRELPQHEHAMAPVFNDGMTLYPNVHAPHENFEYSHQTQELSQKEDGESYCSYTHIHQESEGKESHTEETVEPVRFSIPKDTDGPPSSYGEAGNPSLSNDHTYIRDIHMSQYSQAPGNFSPQIASRGDGRLLDGPTQSAPSSSPPNVQAHYFSQHAPESVGIQHQAHSLIGMAGHHPAIQFLMPAGVSSHPHGNSVPSSPSLVGLQHPYPHSPHQTPFYPSTQIPPGVSHGGPFGVHTQSMALPNSIANHLSDGEHTEQHQQYASTPLNYQHSAEHSQPARRPDGVHEGLPASVSPQLRKRNTMPLLDQQDENKVTRPSLQKSKTMGALPHSSEHNDITPKISRSKKSYNHEKQSLSSEYNDYQSSQDSQSYPTSQTLLEKIRAQQKEQKEISDGSHRFDIQYDDLVQSKNTSGYSGPSTSTGMYSRKSLQEMIPPSQKQKLLYPMDGIDPRHPSLHKRNSL